jgi:malonyl-CoA O-methyltransferase
MSLVKNINWSPLDYREAAVIAREALDEMLSRLDWMALKPNVIVDVGSGVGEATLRLQERYPDALVMALDNTLSMLQAGANAHSVCASGDTLPLADQSVNFIFANLILPWHHDHKKLWREWRRVLRPDGLLLFSALGLDTLREFHSIVDSRALPILHDMHDMGDALLAAGFSDPVLDVNYYTTCYRSKEKLLAELGASGMLAVGDESLDHEKIPLEVTYEVIYAHAFAPSASARVSSSDGVFKVPVSQIVNSKDSSF